MTHLNINSLRYKIIELRKIISYTDTDLISITETKIDASFLDAQFLTENYLSDVTGINMGEVFSLLSIVDYYQNIYQIFSLTSLKYYLLKLELIKVSGLF